MTSIKKFQVTFDCAEPERLARFWCEVLGYVVPPPPEGFATWEDYKSSQPPEQRDSWFACIDPTGVGPRLYFQRVPEGKAAKNRVHLDVRVGTGLVGKSASPHLRPNANAWSRSARYTCERCTTATTPVSRCWTSRGTSSVSTEGPRPLGSVSGSGRDDVVPDGRPARGRKDHESSTTRQGPQRAAADAR